MARVLGGEAAPGERRQRARGARDHGAHVRAGESRTPSARRLRPVHAHALPGAARPDAGDARGGQRDGGPRARVEGCAGSGVLHRVVRRTHRASVGGLARRRGSAVPAGDTTTARATASRAGPRRSRRAICSGRWPPPDSAARCATVDGVGGPAPGRVDELKLEGLSPDAIAATDFRTLVGRVLGWHLIKSTDFTVHRRSGGFYFEGRGFGHGVGLCVLGSVRRAARGDSASDILKAYFPGLKIVDAGLASPAAGHRNAGTHRSPPANPSEPDQPDQPGSTQSTRSTRPTRETRATRLRRFRLVLPPSAEPNRTAIEAMVARELDAMSRTKRPPGPSRSANRLSPVGGELPARNRRELVVGGTDARRAHRSAAAGCAARSWHA